MKAVLSHQSFSSKGRDVLVTEGELSEFTGTRQQVEVQELTNLTKGAKFIKITRLFRWFGASSKLRMYSDKCRFWVISNFLTTDEIGRRITYVFFCDEIDKPTYVRRLFEDYCKIAKMEPSPKDCDAIEKVLRYEKNKKRNRTIAIVILIIAIILFVVSNSD